MTFTTFILLYFFIGITAGIAGGLLGIGGGTIIVPCLYFLLKHVDLPQGYLMQICIGTSLSAILFGNLSSTAEHTKRKVILWDLVKRMTPGALLGCLAGGLFAQYVSAVLLEIFFGFFAFAVGLYFLLNGNKLQKIPSLTRLHFIDWIAFFIAFISSLVGVGGGIFLIPYFYSQHINEKHSLGTSSALCFLISFVGAIFYLLFGVASVGISTTVGFIYIPAFIALALGDAFAALIGAKIAHKLPSPLIKRIFSITMIIVGVLMIL